MARKTDKTKKAAATIADRCLCARIRMLSRMVTGRFDAGLRATGVTANQLMILAPGAFFVLGLFIAIKNLLSPPREPDTL